MYNKLIKISTFIFGGMFLNLTMNCYAQTTYKFYLSSGSGLNYWKKVKYDTWKDIGMQPLLSTAFELNNKKVNYQLSLSMYFQKFEERSDFKLPPNAVYLQQITRNSNQISGYVGFNILKKSKLSINASSGICIGNTKKVKTYLVSADGNYLRETISNTNWGHTISLRQKFDFNWTIKRCVFGLYLLTDSKIVSWKTFDNSNPVTNESYFFFSPGVNVGFSI
jgi:hypothetical protein